MIHQGSEPWKINSNVIFSKVQDQEINKSRLGTCGSSSPQTALQAASRKEEYEVRRRGGRGKEEQEAKRR